MEERVYNTIGGFLLRTRLVFGVRSTKVEREEGFVGRTSPAVLNRPIGYRKMNRRFDGTTPDVTEHDTLKLSGHPWKPT